MGIALMQLSRRLRQRAYNRFAVPGATVSCVVTEKKPFPVETCPLSDIDRGGLSFLTNYSPAVGSEINLIVSPPSLTESFELCGHVIYAISRGPGLTYGYRVGVELKPFTRSGDGNSIQSLNAIKTLEQTYDKRGHK